VENICASETSQLSYVSPPIAGASSASSAGYEDAKDQEGEGEMKKMGPLVVCWLPIYLHPWTHCTCQCTIRSSGVIRSLKSDQAHSGPYFRRGVTSLGRTREFVKALADVVPQRERGIVGLLLPTS